MLNIGKKQLSWPWRTSLGGGTVAKREEGHRNKENESEWVMSIRGGGTPQQGIFKKKEGRKKMFSSADVGDGRG